MTARYATDDEIFRWNQLILANPGGGDVFSSLDYARQKETGGYKAHFVMVEDLAVTILEKTGWPFGRLWYLPKGPNVTSTNALLSVIDRLKPLATARGVFVIRIETELDRSEQPALEDQDLVKATPIIPNPSTITLDISDPLDDVLLRLPQKGRHAIRRAERDGVVVERVEPTDQNCQTMYALLSQTAEGQFGIRNYDYYRTFWQRFAAAGYGQLFFATFDGHVVAGAYAMTYGTKSTYKDGASVRKRTAYGASHFLQWKVIEWAKQNGSMIHDFCGSPPSDQITNPAHRHYGVGLFKLAFNKTVTDYIGCYDAVISPRRYRLWTMLGERLYRRLHYQLHHDSYY